MLLYERRRGLDGPCRGRLPENGLDWKCCTAGHCLELLDWQGNTHPCLSCRHRDCKGLLLDWHCLSRRVEDRWWEWAQGSLGLDWLHLASPEGAARQGRRPGTGACGSRGETGPRRLGLSRLGLGSRLGGEERPLTPNPASRDTLELQESGLQPECLRHGLSVCDAL